MLYFSIFVNKLPSAGNHLVIMHIKDLNPDKFLLILEHGNLSLSECIHLRAVCRQWRDIVESMAKSKQSLNLFGSSLHAEAYVNLLFEVGLQNNNKLSQNRIDFLILAFKNHGSALVRFLVHLFPNVKQLVVYMDNCTVVDLPYFLEKLPQLDHLALFGDICNQKNCFRRTFETIHSLQGLNSLCLFVKSKEFLKDILETKLTLNGQSNEACLPSNSNDLSLAETRLTKLIGENLICSEEFFPILNQLTVSIENWNYLTCILEARNSLYFDSLCSLTICSEYLVRL